MGYANGNIGRTGSSCTDPRQVAKYLRSVPLGNAFPADGEFLQYVGSENEWAPGAGGGITVHYLGGIEHDADSLANLNSKLTDAILDDVSGVRTPALHGFRDVHYHSDIDVNPITVQDDSSEIETALNLLNFTGDGVIASSLGGGSVEVNIPGGGSGGLTESQILHLIWATH